MHKNVNKTAIKDYIDCSERENKRTNNPIYIVRIYTSITSLGWLLHGAGTYMYTIPYNKLFASRFFSANNCRAKLKVNSKRTIKRNNERMRGSVQYIYVYTSTNAINYMYKQTAQHWVLLNTLDIVDKQSLIHVIQTCRIKTDDLNV